MFHLRVSCLCLYPSHRLLLLLHCQLMGLPYLWIGVLFQLPLFCLSRSDVRGRVIWWRKRPVVDSSHGSGGGGFDGGAVHAGFHGVGGPFCWCSFSSIDCMCFRMANYML